MTPFARLAAYAIHGRGLDSLWKGFDEIGMPHHRQQYAMDAVRAILVAEGAQDFCWYKVPNTIELAAFWSGCDRNKLWIGPGNVHVDPDVAFPLTVTGLMGGYQPTHHLPGATPGSQGSRTATTQPQRPLPCQHCMNPHGPDDECY